MMRLFVLGLLFAVACGPKPAPPPPAPPPPPPEQTSALQLAPPDYLQGSLTPIVVEEVVVPMSPSESAEALRVLQARCDQLPLVSYPSDEKALAIYLLKPEGEKLSEFTVIGEEAARLAQAGASFEDRSAALYLWAVAHTDYAGVVEGAPCSPNLDEETCALYQEVLAQKTRVFHEYALARHRANVSLAEQEGQTSTWVEKSRLALEQPAP